MLFPVDQDPWMLCPGMKISIKWLWMGASVDAIVQVKWSKFYFKFSITHFSHNYLGNLTIFSNRILIRFTAGSFKMDAANRKGLLAECSLVPLGTKFLEHTSIV